jgi:hypothetical protein
VPMRLQHLHRPKGITVFLWSGPENDDVFQGGKTGRCTVPPGVATVG